MATINHVSGKSYRVCTDADNDVYDELSFETDASDVNFTDGTDAESSLGQIKGITSDVTGEAEDIAASIKVVNNINRSLPTFIYDESTGKITGYTTTIGGADSVFPFSGGTIYNLGVGRSFNIATIVGSENVSNYTNDNFIAVPTGSSINKSPMQTVGSSDYPSATATLSSGSITYDASTGTVTVSGFILTATQYCYQNGQGPLGSATKNLDVTVYFIDGVEIK